MYTSNIIFLLLGGNMIIHGKLTTGGLTAILSYVMQTFNSLIMLSNVFVTFAKAIASLTRINEVLNVCPDIVSGDVMSLDNASIEFNNVSFHYKQSNSAKDVLSNISFKLENGQTLGILGETGSAKSTLVSLIARLYDVTSGNIKIGDKDIKEYDLNVLRKNIGFVLQQANLFEGSLKENLCWARPDLTDEEISKVLHDSCVDEFLDRLPNGLDTYIGEGGNTLSGGQKQRVSIARALLKNPRILILDDSTSAVDTQTEKKIRHALEKLPITKIIISQRILSVMSADLVLILEGGKINEINTPQALLEHNHIYKDLFDRQLKGVDLNE
jgi:ATP-binding cassette subfamily B protein